MGGTPKALRPQYSTTVTILKQTSSHDAKGYPLVGHASSGITYRAHIEQGEAFVRTETGQIVVGHRKVFLYSSTGWATSSIPRVVDKIILPPTHPPTSPQMLSVAPVSDENGIHHILILTEW